MLGEQVNPLLYNTSVQNDSVKLFLEGVKQRMSSQRQVTMVAPYSAKSCAQTAGDQGNSSLEQDSRSTLVWLTSKYMCGSLTSTRVSGTRALGL